MAIYGIGYLNESSNNVKLEFNSKFKSTSEDFKVVEDRLGIKLPTEYKNLCKKGSFRTYGYEFTCCNPNAGYIYVVDKTLTEREIARADISKFFVLSDLGIEGLLLLMDSSGVVYEYSTISTNPPKKVYNSIKEFIDNIDEE